jgi:hypothetical protein
MIRVRVRVKFMTRDIICAFIQFVVTRRTLKHSHINPNPNPNQYSKLILSCSLLMLR